MERIPCELGSADGLDDVRVAVPRCERGCELSGRFKQ